MNSNDRRIQPRKLLEQGHTILALGTGGGVTTLQPLTDTVIGAQQRDTCKVLH